MEMLKKQTVKQIAPLKTPTYYLTFMRFKHEMCFYNNHFNLIAVFLGK